MKKTELKYFKDNVNNYNKSFILFAVILIFIIKGMLYAIYIIPPTVGASPDDVGHISYIQYIASEKKLPILNETTMENITQEAFNAYYHLGKNDIPILFVTNEEFNTENDLNWIVQHPPLYYVLMVPIYLLAKLFTNRFDVLLIILRLVTISFGVASIYIMNAMMNLLNTKDIVRYCILICFVFSTPIQYYFSNITNDSLLIFLCILTLYYLLKYIIKKQTKYYYIFVICCALVILTKYTGALVLISYIGYFLYKSFKEDGFKKTFKLCIKGVILGGIIVAPVFFRNYLLYGNPVALSSESLPVHEVSFFQFIKEKGYLNELYNHIVTLIGWKYMIRPTTFIKAVVAILLSFLASLCIVKDNKEKNQLRFLFLGTTLILCSHHILDLQLCLCLSLSSFIIICYHVMFFKEIDIKKRELNKFFFIVITGFFLIFMLKHYDICLNRGHTGAMHGRYYYAVTFPFLFLIFNILAEYKYKYTKYVPFILTTVLMICEAQTIMRCIALW